MNFLLWIKSTVELYEFCCKISEKLSGKKTTDDKLNSINGKLLQIQDFLSVKENKKFDAYASTIYSANFFYKETVIKELKGTIINSELELQKTVVMERKNEIIEMCQETLAELRITLGTLPSLNDEEMANLADILNSEAEVTKFLKSSEIPIEEQKTLTMQNIEFTISTPIFQSSVSSPSKKIEISAGNCVHCKKEITQHKIDHHRAIKRKNDIFCMKCICDENAGDFPTVGKYRILHRIGKGGMANVYLAVHTALRTMVAFKWLKGMEDSSPAQMHRFKIECQISANLRHPNAVQFFDAGNDAIHEGNEVYYIVMELVEGETLDDYQKQNGKFQVNQAISIAQELGEVLNYAFHRHIIHRDIKPCNIFILQDGKIKLGDFGLAKFLDENNMSGTKTGMAMGTIHYMPPEQFVNAKNTDQRSDIYSVGATLYKMLTGEFVFDPDGCSLVQYAEKVLSEKPKPPSHFVSNIPKFLDDIIMKCLEKEPQNRYTEPMDLITALKNR